MIMIIDQAAFWACWVWVAGPGLHFIPGVSWYCRAFRPWSLPVLLVSLGCDAFEPQKFAPPVVIAVDGFQVLIWWWRWSRGDSDDDDRWKRRLRRAGRRVAELGGKLVVVPTRNS